MIKEVKMSRYNRKFKKVVKTGLSKSKVVNDILNSVIGQMADGIWENSSYMAGYWNFVEISKDNNICLCDRPWDWEGRNTLNNKFYGMSDKDVKTFFAKKIKKIVSEELKDNYIDGKRTEFYSIYGLNPHQYEAWNKKLTEDRELAEKQLQEYLKKHPFKLKDFNENNDTPLYYLNYKENVTVADAYEVYKSLMN